MLQKNRFRTNKFLYLQENRVWTRNLQGCVSIICGVIARLNQDFGGAIYVSRGECGLPWLIVAWRQVKRSL